MSSTTNVEKKSNPSLIGMAHSGYQDIPVEEANFENMNKLKELIAPIRIAMLTTVDEKGHLHSRPMHTSQIEFNGKELWFFSYRTCHKMDDLSKNDNLNLSYVDPSNHTYVSIYGRGHLSLDKAKMKELWNPALKIWFPKELDDPEMCLLKIDVKGAEYWDSHSSNIVYVFGMVKSIFTGQAYQPSATEEKKIVIGEDEIKAKKSKQSTV